MLSLVLATTLTKCMNIFIILVLSVNQINRSVYRHTG